MTTEQSTLIDKLLKSHVFTEQEKSDGHNFAASPVAKKKTAMAFIDTLTKLVKDRKAAEKEAEKQAAAEAEASETLAEFIPQTEALLEAVMKEFKKDRVFAELWTTKRIKIKYDKKAMLKTLTPGQATELKDEVIAGNEVPF